MKNVPSISGRLWNGETLALMTSAVEDGISQGMSAKKMASRIKEYLNDPNDWHRRFRYKIGEDEDGNSVFGRKWKKREWDESEKRYKWVDHKPGEPHPGHVGGPGAYRSSYKNALRYTRTTINIAYRTADYDQYQLLPFVRGIEIRLSNNHPVPDICDDLAGEYPKDFKWTGWHPNCRCYQVPLLAKTEEVDKMVDSILDGGEPDEVDVQDVVNDLPDNFKKWAKDNKERIVLAAERGTVPYFIRDNQEKVEDVVNVKILQKEPKVENAVLQSDRLSKEQNRAWYQNERIIEHYLGIGIGDPMSFEEADEHRSNPNFIKGSDNGATKNCQSAVVAYEMRRRGFDVEAMLNTKKKGNGPFELSKDTTMAWIDPKTGREPIAKGIGIDVYQITGEDSLRVRMFDPRNYEPIELDTGRYHIRWRWNEYRGGGHIIAIDAKKGAGCRFYDPQTGEVFSLDAVWKKILPNVERGTMQIYRVDNLMPNPEIAKNVVAKTGSVKVNKVRTAEDKALTSWKRSYNKWKKAGYDDEHIKKVFHPYFKGDDEFEKKVWTYIKGRWNGRGIFDSSEVTQKEIYKQTVKWGKENLVGKRYSNPAFGGKTAVFSSNSIKENLGFGSLFEVKREILMNIDDYLLENLIFKYEKSVHGDNKGFYKAIVDYVGNVIGFEGRKVELSFAIRPSGDIEFYFIKLI